ncbi:hypothetical protein GCM10022254_39580 [Actinomadura meridiana]|uniref:Uncharacterized protein n=1 Tax=Actinomadura meridiana TaxID=559626 RepID=A0ABP8C760_9ACTN
MEGLFYGDQGLVQSERAALVVEGVRSAIDYRHYGYLPGKIERALADGALRLDYLREVGRDVFWHVNHLDWTGRQA